MEIKIKEVYKFRLKRILNVLLFSIITSQIFFSSCKLTSGKEEIKRPNVLVIMVDDMNGYASRPKFNPTWPIRSKKRKN
jgi:hypothetical protein